MTVPSEGSPRRLFEQCSSLTEGSPASVADSAARRPTAEHGGPPGLRTHEGATMRGPSAAT